LVHEGGWKVEWWGEGRPVFFDPRGGTHFDGRWRAPELQESPVPDLIEENRRRGADPDGWTAASRWKREADIPDRIYFGALEAGDSAAPPRRKIAPTACRAVVGAGGNARVGAPIERGEAGSKLLGGSLRLMAE
jgi:hypothetical protein